jgi:hypothetical protein
MRAVALLGTLAVAALAAVALSRAQQHPEQALGGGGVGALALQLVAGLGAYAAGLDLALRRNAARSGALLAASGVALLLGAAPLPDAGGPLLFTAALAFGTFAPLLAGAAAACHPQAGRLGTAIVAGTAAAIAALGVFPALVFDPEASGCFDCPRNLLLAHGDPKLYDALTDARPWINGTLCAALAAIALVRWAHRPALVRRATASVGIGGALVAAVGASGDDLWLVQCALLALVAGAVAVEAVRARLLRGQIADIVVATLPSPEKLRDALAQRLGDARHAIA